MALASASPRPSAQIIPLPGAAAAPVVNPKRRLRFARVDRNVTHIAKLRVDRAWRLRKEYEAAAEAQRKEVQDGAIELLRVALAHLQGASHV